MHDVMILSSLNMSEHSDSLRLYLPLFTNSSLLYGHSLMTAFSSLLSLELFLLFISLIVNTMLILSIRTSSLMHINLKMICIAHLSEYYVYAIAQVVLVCYQSGILIVKGTVWQDIWLISAGFYKLHFMWSTIFVQTATVFERTVATKYITNYEVMRSKSCGLLICIVKCSVSLTVSYLILSLRLRFGPASSLVGGLLIVTAIWYLILLAYNKKLLAGCNISMYSLSSKYQVTENIRILKLVRNVFVLITTAVCCVVAAMGVARQMTSFYSLQPFIVIALELVIASFPLEMLVIVLWDSKKRNHLAHRLDQKARQRMYSTKVQKDENLRWDSAQESLIYFKQLNSSWSKQRQ